MMMMTMMITLHAFLMRNLSCFSFFTKALLAAASPADTATASEFDLGKKCDQITLAASPADTAMLSSDQRM